jgi:hypothetical protein
MAMAASSSRRSSDLARSVSLCVVGVRRYPRQQWRPRRGGFYGTRMLSGGGESIVLLQLRWWEEVDLDPRQHGDVPRSTCHNNMCLATCSRPIHPLTKSCWRWWFLGSGNGGGSTFLSTCVSTINCKVFRITILFPFIFCFQRMLHLVT